MEVTVYTNPVPSDENKRVEVDSQEEVGITHQMIWEDIFMGGNMPRLQRYIVSMESNKSYMHLCSFYIPNIVFRGISQVFLCNHPVTGVFICIGLALTSVELMFHAIIGSAMGSVGTFIVGGYPLSEIENGLAGKDGTLVACACFTFLDGRYGAAIVLSFFAGFVNTILSNFMNSSFSLPALTLAFNFVMLSFLGGINTGNITAVKLKSSLSDSVDTSMSFWFMIDAIFRGVGQFIFADTTWGGLLIVIGITIASRPSAVSVVLGSFLACISALYILQIPDPLIADVRRGLYGYNTAGVFAAISGNVFYIFNRNSIFYGFIGSFLSVLILVGSKTFFGSSEWNLPVMTVPFCLTTWFMMYLRAPALTPLDQRDAPARHTVRALRQSTYLDNSMHSYLDESLHSSASKF